MLKSKTGEDLIAKTPPKYFWHYTSSSAFLGILQNRKIWASNALCMNDLKEIKHATFIAKSVLANQSGDLSRRGLLRDDEPSLLEEMSKRVDNFMPHVFVTSLSERENVLSQWRAY